jgi:hypothetical protein
VAHHVSSVGSYQLPVGFRLGAVFQSIAGAERALLYPVDRTILPTLVQTSVNVRLNERGTLFEDRVHQLDLNIGRAFRMANLRVAPQVELFQHLQLYPVNHPGQHLRLVARTGRSRCSRPVWYGWESR